MSALPTFAEILANCTVYKPRVGNKARTFKTEVEVEHYEAGYRAFPSLLYPATSAGNLGFSDAEGHDEERHERRAEERAERWER